MTCGKLPSLPPSFPFSLPFFSLSTLNILLSYRLSLPPSLPPSLSSFRLLYTAPRILRQEVRKVLNHTLFTEGALGPVTAEGSNEALTRALNKSMRILDLGCGTVRPPLPPFLPSSLCHSSSLLDGRLSLILPPSLPPLPSLRVCAARGSRTTLREWWASTSPPRCWPKPRRSWFTTSCMEGT